MNAERVEKQKMTFSLIKAKQMTRKVGAEDCGMSYGAFCRKYSRWLREGDAVFVHGLAGKPSNHKSKVSWAKVLDLRKTPAYRNDYFADFRRCLAKFEGIHISYTSLYTFLTKNNIVCDNYNNFVFFKEVIL